MERIVIELPKPWIHFAQSPVRIVATVITCLSLTFAPVFLFLRGKAGVGLGDPGVVLSFAAIFLIPLVYLRLATILLNQIKSGASSDSIRPSASLRTDVLLWFGAALAAVAIYLLFRS
jgi:hypothetical protein